MSWRRRLAKALELEPAGVPVPVTRGDDGSVLLHLGSKPINLGRLPEGVVDEDIHDVPDFDRTVQAYGFSLGSLGAELRDIPSKRVLGGAGLALLVALFLSHAAQNIRRRETEGTVA